MTTSSSMSVNARRLRFMDECSSLKDRPGNDAVRRTPRAGEPPARLSNRERNRQEHVGLVLGSTIDHAHQAANRGEAELVERQPHAGERGTGRLAELCIVEA